MSKYIDVSATIQVIGNIFKEPNLLDNEKYHFNEDDFPNDFHKVIFGTVYNLHALGNKVITIDSIEDYLSQRPKSMATYKANKGREYLEKVVDMINPQTFPYYYSRLKKFTLLRMYNETCGMDLSWLYDVDNILDVKKKQEQEDWLDNVSLEEIANKIDKKIENIKISYVDDYGKDAAQAGDGLMSLVEELKAKPEFGYPMYGKYMNTIFRGARLKKVYMRSAATGVGKSRSMIADACTFACDEIYDTEEQKWVRNGTKEPTLFISTEQELSEIQTMMLAFVAGVNEEHILTGQYVDGEYERIKRASMALSTAPLYIEELPDFSLQDIEDCIKKNIHDHDCRYICHDYIHTSMKILSEISSKAGIKGLREDNILFMIGVRLKDIANQYGVFILTATQLNGDWKEAKILDQNLLRGAKSLGDKIDGGMIMVPVNQEDLEALRTVINKGGFEMPDIKISVYKNRRGRYKDVLLWCKSDRGTCRINPIFVTDYQYGLIDIKDIKINVKPKEEIIGAF